MPASDFVHLTEDKHQQALYRLAAVGQYLYDTMAGDEDSDRPEPMPGMAMDCVREAQRQIDLAIKHGQRTRRRCLSGDLRLIEWPYDAPGPDRDAFPSQERNAIHLDAPLGEGQDRHNSLSTERRTEDG